MGISKAMHLPFGRPSPGDTPCASTSAENNELPRTKAPDAQWVCLVPPEWRDLRSPLARQRSSPTLQCPALPSTTAFSVTVPQLSDALASLHGCRDARSARGRVLTPRVPRPLACVWVHDQAMRHMSSHVLLPFFDTHIRGVQSTLLPLPQLPRRLRLLSSLLAHQSVNSGLSDTLHFRPHDAHLDTRGYPRLPRR